MAVPAAVAVIHLLVELEEGDMLQAVYFLMVYGVTFRNMVMEVLMHLVDTGLCLSLEKQGQKLLDISEVGLKF